ncbi:MFS transporter [Mycolicibacterium goodii]|nr:MFS transporter [Mycolicibacterium goodii]
MFAFVVVCLNLRIALSGIGPLIPVFDLGQATVTVLTMIPPLCMGLFAPLGALTRRIMGEERALFVAMLVLTVGIAIRSAGIAGLFVGTVVASVAIAVLNVLTPVLVRKRVPSNRVGPMMVLYAMLMGCGAAVIAAATIPIFTVTGSWSIALGIAIIPALVGVAALSTQLWVPDDRIPAVTTQPVGKQVLRNRTAWSVTGFFSIQTVLFYTLIAWLPAILLAQGADTAIAGFYFALLLVGVAAGGFLGPAWAGSRADQQTPIAVTIVLCVVGVVGVLTVPFSAVAPLVVLLGVGLGAGQGIPGVLYLRRAVDQQTAAQLSSMAQTVGYLVAATGPVVAAVLRERTGGWTWPLVLLLVLLAVNAVISRAAGRGGAGT